MYNILTVTWKYNYSRAYAHITQSKASFFWDESNGRSIWRALQITNTDIYLDKIHIREPQVHDNKECKTAEQNMRFAVEDGSSVIRILFV